LRNWERETFQNMFCLKKTTLITNK
jgi:hypothetical protein